MPTVYPDIERFIHDELVARCMNAVHQMKELWRGFKRIHPTLLIWPADSVRTTLKERFSGVIFTELPEDPAERRAAIINAAKRCDAYGLLLTEQLEHDVRLIFESESGTMTWRFPIKNHGDVQVLGAPVSKVNTESIGIRWRAN